MATQDYTLQAEQEQPTDDGQQQQATPPPPASAPAQVTPITDQSQQQPQVSNYAELETYLQQQMAENKPETDEQRKKRERKEKWEGIISGIGDMGMALSNLFFTTQYAPNMYDGNQSLSAKTKERIEKAKAEREANKDKYMNFALQLGKARGDDQDRQFKREQAAQQQANWQATFDAGRADRAADEEYRQGRAAAQDAQWQATFDYNKDKDERNFNESVRQFNVSSSLQRQQIGIQAQRLQMERENNSQVYTLGEGKGMVTVPKAAINSHNFASIYQSLPQQYRTAKGDPIYGTDALGNKTVLSYGDPSAEAMAIAVGAYLGDQSVPADQKTATRAALSQIGKQSGGNSRTMPGVN